MEALKQKTPTRSYIGEHWKTNSSNKKRLVMDFEKKCAYCDDHHHYSGGYVSYHVEHFAPKDKFKHLEFVYDNLLYSCPYCNGSKSNKWVGKNEFENIIGDKGFIDPCSDEYNKHLCRNIDGSIGYITEIGKYMHKELKLYLKRHQLVHNLERVRLKKNLLKSKIDEMECNGENAEKLIGFHNDLCVVFCEYYDLFFEDE